jgi:hypothetical protein
VVVGFHASLKRRRHQSRNHLVQAINDLPKFTLSLRDEAGEI